MKIFAQLFFAAFAFLLYCHAEQLSAFTAGRDILGDGRSYAEIEIIGDGRFAFPRDNRKPAERAFGMAALLSALESFKNCDTVVFSVPRRPDTMDKVRLNPSHFRICVLPRLLRAGYKNISVLNFSSSGAFNYDSLKDPFVADFLAHMDASKAGYEARNKLDMEGVSAPIEKFVLPPGAPWDDNDYYACAGHLPLADLKRMGEEGDEEAMFWYGRSLISPYMKISSSKPRDTGVNIPEGLKVIEKFAAKGHLGAIKTLYFLYSGYFELSACDTEGEFAPGEHARLEKLYKSYRDDALAMKYSAMLARLGDSVHVGLVAESLLKEGRDMEAADFFEKYSSGNMPDFHSLYILLSDALGYSGYEAVSMGCMCYGYHIVPDWGDMRDVKKPQLFFKYAKILADANPYSDDALVLAHAYLYGIGVRKDEKKAFEVACKASVSLSYESCGIPGIGYMAYAYGRGVGVEADEETASLYWKMFYAPLALDHDSAQAALDTAARFYNGFGVPKDKAVAFGILEKYLEICMNSAGSDAGRLKGFALESGLYAAKTLCALYSGKYSEDDKNPEALGRLGELVGKLENAIGGGGKEYFGLRRGERP